MMWAFAILCLPLVGAGLSLLSRRVTRVPLWLLPVPAALTFLALVQTGVGATAAMDWIPSLDVALLWHVSGLGWLLGVLVSGIGTLIVLYGSAYMHDRDKGGRLCFLLYLFQFAMLGIAIADHLLVLFIFWELTGLISYLLIGFSHENAQSRRNALQALLVTGLGGLALLAGVILLATAAGTWQISSLSPVQDHALYVPLTLLIFAGALTKSAQFPFHFWLPNAMAAPTPVSAYLHSATMVKAGVFLLALLSPVLGGTPLWMYTLTVSGGITLLIGGWFGVRQHDMKAILAGTTLGVLGCLTFLLGLGNKKAVAAAMVLWLAHALYKAALFMAAGSVDHATGTRDMRRLGGLRRLMPWTFAAVLLAALSKMGLPPFLGFLAKETIYKAGNLGALAWVLLPVLVMGNVLMFALALKILREAFVRPRPAESWTKEAHEVSAGMWLGSLILAVLGLLVGVAPGLVSGWLEPAVQQVAASSKPLELHLWTGFNLPLLLSGVTVVGGVAMYRWAAPRYREHRAMLVPGDRIYNVILMLIVSLAVWQTRKLQSGVLRRYMQMIVITVTVLAAMELVRWQGLWHIDLQGLSVVGVVAGALMIGFTIVAVRSRSRLTAIVSLGMVGFGVALFFALFSAPDLAITQILVETLTVVFFAWVVHKLPPLRDFSERKERLRDAIIAGAAGLLMAALVLKSLAAGGDSTLSQTLTDWSLPKAYGANVVNVILVDFRALDTWGEITVLAIAAIGAHALLWSLRSRKTEESA